MRLIRLATVAALLAIAITAIGLPRMDGYLHWFGKGWLIGWQIIQYTDEGSLQISVCGRLVVDWYWSR